MITPTFLTPFSIGSLGAERTPFAASGKAAPTASERRPRRGIPARRLRRVEIVRCSAQRRLMRAMQHSAKQRCQVWLRVCLIVRDLPAATSFRRVRKQYRLRRSFDEVRTSRHWQRTKMHAQALAQIEAVRAALNDPAWPEKRAPRIQSCRDQRQSIWPNASQIGIHSRNPQPSYSLERIHLILMD